MTTTINALQIRKILGRDEWRLPEPYGPDGWIFVAADRSRSIIVTAFPQDGEEWIHASIARHDQSMPMYDELAILHRAVFGDGWAYQVFAPSAKHVNIHNFALHLWGRADGAAALPDFVGDSKSV